MTKIKTTTADRQALDAIATLLGTSADWSPGSEFLEDIANIIGSVRPHPGDSADTYRSNFHAATGRNVPAKWDFTPDDKI
jgi:hypothetical protein